MPQDQMQVDFTQMMNELANRLRVLEGKQSLFSEKLLVMNQNMIEEYKKVMREMKAIDGEIKDMKKEINTIKNIVRHLTDEAGKFAKNSDVKVLEKYIKLWDPMHFVSETQVQQMIQNALKAHESARAPKVKKDDAN